MPRSVAVNEAGLRIGESHPNAKYTNGEIEMVLTLRGEGNGYKRISYMMEMPKRTVRSICNGHRRCQTPTGWKTVQE